MVWERNGLVSQFGPPEGQNWPCVSYSRSQCSPYTSRVFGCCLYSILVYSALEAPLFLCNAFPPCVSSRPRDVLQKQRVCISQALPSSLAKMRPHSKSRTTRLHTASLLTQSIQQTVKKATKLVILEGSLMSPMKNFTSLRASVQLQ